MESIYERVAPRLKAARKAQGMTQADVAEKANITVSFLSFLETAKRKGSLVTYIKLAQVLGISTGDLFDEEPGKAKGAKKPQGPFGNLNPSEMKAVVKLVKMLRKGKL